MRITALLCLLFLATACSPEPKKETPKKVEVESLIEYKDGIYTEFYPDKKVPEYTNFIAISSRTET